MAFADLFEIDQVSYLVCDNVTTAALNTFI